MKRPVYRLTIDIDDEGMDFIGLVDYPAHGKNYITLSKLPKKVEPKFQFNEEKRIVTGVAIATDQLIYRRDDDGYEYDVYFTKQDVFKIMKMFAKKGYHNNVNLMHDMSQKVNDCYMIESYFINDERTNIPKEFANQNLRAGSLIFSYYVEGNETWKFVKENGAGFSLEGWFSNVAVKFLKTKTNKMSKKQSLLERLGFKADKAKFNKENFAEATTVDGDVVMWEGEIIAGETALFVVPAEGEEPVLYPAGETSFEVDGVLKVVTVDENGIVTAIVDAEEMESEESAEVVEAMAALKADYEAKFSAFKVENDSKVVTLAKEVEELREAIEKISETKAPKKVSQSADKVPAWKTMKNNLKK